MTTNGFSYHAVSGSWDSAVWQTNCKNTNQFEQENPEEYQFSTATELPSENEQPANITNCSTSLQLLPATNHFLFNPGQQDQPIFIHSSSLASQLFVVQEPDPPRLI